MVIVRSAADAPPRPAPNRSISELISAEAAGARGVTLRVVELVAASAQTPRRPHAHADYEELIYVLEGQGRMWAAGQTVAISRGDAVLVPAGIFHATFNAGETPLRLACFFPVAAGVDDVILADHEVDG